MNINLTETENININTFDQNGKLYQVEYARKAAERGSLVIGIQSEFGVVLAAEKQIPSCLLEPKSVNRIFKVDEKICCAFSGMEADAREIIERIRIETQNHWFVYNEQISMEGLIDCISEHFIDFQDGTLTKMSRPYGVAMLFIGIDGNKPMLYYLQNDGEFEESSFKCIGDGSKDARKLVVDNKIDIDHLTINEAVKMSIELIQKKMKDEKITCNNIQIMTIELDQPLKILSDDELTRFIGRIDKDRILQ